MVKEYIEVRGASENNLKNLSIKLPRDKLIVITGVSGSGKSSLAFNTIYAEGQRRYIESMSTYARNFLGQMDKPEVESIEGLSPAISIDQKNAANNPRSTVGTVTELHDYLRLLYARIGVPHCPICGEEVGKQSAQQMVNRILELPEMSKVKIAAPIVRDQKGAFKELFKDLIARGYTRMEVDGNEYDLAIEVPELEETYDHSVDIIVDRIEISENARSRITDSVETALTEAKGVIKIIVPNPSENIKLGTQFRRTGDLSGKTDSRLIVEFSEEFACSNCKIDLPEIETRSFSFNSPHGACPKCEGIGHMKEVIQELVIRNKKSPLKDAIGPWNYKAPVYKGWIDSLADHFGVSIDTPFGELDPEVQNAFMRGTKEKVKLRRWTRRGMRWREGPFEGIIPSLERRYIQTDSQSTREHIEKYMAITTCASCMGTRLKPESRAVKVAGNSITKINQMGIGDALVYFTNLDQELNDKEKQIAEQIIKGIHSRLKFMCEVGLEYLTLDREARTLSGGESQRIRLATQIGSGLVGVLYVLDEPSIGLHQRDNDRLLNTLEGLRDMGNTLIVVEHDEETMFRADYIADIGPGAGRNGGEVVAQGTVDQIMKCKNSLTGKYLSGEKEIPMPEKRRMPSGNIEIKGAIQHNLKNIDVSIPMGILTVITGVSGSGKSTLVHEILYKSLARKIHKNRSIIPGNHKSIEGYDQIQSVRLIDQNPIGRTPRSNPATYTGVFTHIRELFSKTKVALQRGYKPGRFSFNVKGGRCEVCNGQGNVRIEMNFLSDVYVVCEECKESRYNDETLEVRYKGKNIADVLDMSIEEARDFFENNKKILRSLDLMYDVGLGYMKLGQSSTTLSGGEAQRVKLSQELGKKEKGNTLYLLDEPTTGLHPEDEAKLIEVLHRLVDRGNTVVVIEHELDLIKNADHIIDLGPGGGEKGGEIVAEGTPEEIIGNKKSYTAQYLKEKLK